MTILLLLCTFYSFSSFCAVTEKALTLYFNSDQYGLTEHHQAELDAFLESVSLESDYEFLVRGHTDQDGSQAYNVKLSENRALSICAYLYKKNVNPELTSMGFAGEKELAIHDLSSASKAKNRRVHLIFRLYQFNSLSEVEELLTQPYTTKDIFNSQTSHTMTGCKGTELHFSPDCFLTSTGEPYKGNVEISLNEALDLEAFLAHGLSTTSHGEMLISGGMLKVTAQDENGNDLILDDSKPMEVFMPTQNLRSDMNVFVSKDGSDWEITDQKPLTSEDNNTTVEDVRLPSPPPFVFKEPNFKGKNKPRKPVIIATPKLPALPDSSRYFKKIPWYTLTKKEVEDRQKTSFDKAMSRYREKVKDYERRTALRARQEATYEKDMKDYEEKLVAWENEFQAAKMEYMNRAMEEQYAEYIHRLERDSRFYFGDFSAAAASENLTRLRENFENQIQFSASQKARYAFNMASLGWVNIDCFTGNKEKKKSILVHNPEPDPKVAVKLLFPDINSCLGMSSRNFKKYSQGGVPVSQNPHVVAYKIEDGLIYYCERELDAANRAHLKLERISFVKFQERLKALA